MYQFIKVLLNIKIIMEHKNNQEEKSNSNNNPQDYKIKSDSNNKSGAVREKRKRIDKDVKFDSGKRNK